jgi:type IV fimbrial biogenesis protein FimT
MKKENSFLQLQEAPVDLSFRQIKRGVVSVFNHGFTLIELMVKIAIVAVLAMIALPSFGGLFAELALRQQTGTFMDDLRLARSTATKRGVSVSVCASSSSQDETPACQVTAANVDWSQGWIIYVENSSPVNSTFDSGVDELVYRQEPLNNSKGVKTGSGGSSGAPPINVRFNPDGRTPGQIARFEFKAGNDDATLDRSICLATTGRTRVVIATGSTAC